MSFHEAALENMEEVTAAAPDHAGAWRALAALLRLAARDAEADTAEAKANSLAQTDTQWHDAEGEHAIAQLERLDHKIKDQLEAMSDELRMAHLRDVLLANPLDVAAMRYLANEEHIADDPITATHLLERALALSPTYLAARIDYAKVLASQRDHLAVLRQTEILIATDPGTLAHRMLRADSAVQAERFDEALSLLEYILRQEPDNAHILNTYGNLLKTLGRREESVKTYRKLLAVAPGTGGAYFGLSELKANYLNDADVAAMRDYLAEGVEDLTSRKCMAYALGQTLERARNYEASFKAYAFGAQVCQEEVDGTHRAYNPENFENRLARIRGVFTVENMAARAVKPGDTRPAVTPIYVIGMPRAGSTLVEQILASHSLVEGTRELPVVTGLVKKIAMSRLLVNNDVYPERVLDFDRAHLDALGQDCLDGTAYYRSTTLPYVVDKRPWNWIDACFIHLILPQARFIDIRRAPMAAGFAMYKQLLPADAAFTFDLGHLGHYYRAYVDFMDYMDTAMPGRILRVSYPDLVNDTETQIRRMLDYCGLPFEENCLRFWETDRAVLTPSAEQVRRPIFKDALEQWRNFEPWLGPLKESLGDLAES
jgi:Flp pilus assembly protein TadD